MVGDRVFRDETLEFFLEQAPIMGEIAMKHFRNLGDGDVELKEGRKNDPVTIADLEIRDHIVPVVESENGDDVILLTEESVKGFDYTREQLMRMRKPLIIIDEIDGTRNFSQGNPDFSILLALAEPAHINYQVTAGVVYHPPSGDVYFATKDSDAIHRTIDGIEKTLQVSNRNEMRAGETPVIAEIARDVWPDDYPLEYCEVGNAMNGFRFANVNQVEQHNRFSWGLEIMDVAKGDVDVSMCAIGANWDYAAPAIILKQAGGSVYLAGSRDNLKIPRVWTPQLDKPGEYHPAFFTNGAIDRSLFEYMKQFNGVRSE